MVNLPTMGVGGAQRYTQVSERPRPTATIVVIPPSKTTVGTTATTLYTVPDKKFFLIEEATLTNVAGGDETVTIHHVESGGSAGTGNAVIYQETFVSSTSYRLSTLSGLMLASQESLQALTSTSGGVNITLWGSLIEGS